MRGKPELLAPAGDWEALVAAVENGADAVYLGGKLFNARQSAANFDDLELGRAVHYAHVRGVRVYVTVNTLLDYNEVKEAVRFLHFLQQCGATPPLFKIWACSGWPVRPFRSCPCMPAPDDRT